ncbi:gfo/Idh/MocA family oxidoreductase [Archaeoglobales archaeon]|nr:MAG: gfo/Idh/MocA family oxidoreductase [Archaeoglobales archaeon]
MIDVGVIGVGAIGKHHARVYSEIDTVNLVGVSDINENVGKEVANTFKTKFYTDYIELLEKVDAVSIAVPTSLHVDVGVVAAKHGVHMLVEKPIADSITNAERLIKEARKNKVKMMVGHIERFNPAILVLKDLAKKGELGDILTMMAERVGPYSPRIRDVGIIIDLAVHDIDTISYIYEKRAKEVYTIAGNSFHTSEDHASILLKFPGNRAGIINTNWLTPKKIRKLTSVGTGSVARVDYLSQDLELIKSDGIFGIDVPKKEPLRNEIEEFLRCIEEGKKPSPSGEDGKYVLEVAISAIRSYKEGRTVDLREMTV